MKVTWNWALIAAVATFLAGAVGSALTPILGTEPASIAQDILQAVAGVAALLGGGGAVKVAVTIAEAKAMARLGIVETHVIEVQK